MSDAQTGPTRERGQRTWIGEALAAFDQSLGALPQDGSWPDASYWLQRAQVAATIASAEQARIGNLIAWKQLRQAASASIESLPNAGDEISDEIEQALGIEDGTTEEPGRVVARHATHGTGYVRVVPRHGGLSDVTTEAGSTYAVHDEQIRWLDAPPEEPTP